MSTVEAERLAARESFRISVPNGLSAPKIARDMVAYLLILTGHSIAADTARILVSEVVTNVHDHTTTLIIHIDVSVAPAHVSVAVWDNKPHMRPRLRSAGDEDEQGRGLHLVEKLSSAWGVTWPHDSNQLHKRVWFALDERRIEVAA
ncbi:ATP-binding protein [Streptomyces sp. NPDC048611]|uniref:ATP-binding protein n=1 Tax=Streptomyces sp. NPDC048611 TaxID=3155635 RepID=UPI00341BF7DC